MKKSKKYMRWYRRDRRRLTPFALKRIKDFDEYLGLLCAQNNNGQPENITPRPTRNGIPVSYPKGFA